MTLKLILLVFAFVCFVIATIGISHPRLNLIGAGLAFLTASMLF